MIELIAGFVLCYAIGVVQVYRERVEYFARNGGGGNPLLIALKWPWAVGPKW
jgi:hypothetical protein